MVVDTEGAAQGVPRIPARGVSRKYNREAIEKLRGFLASGYSSQERTFPRLRLIAQQIKTAIAHLSHSETGEKVQQAIVNIFQVYSQDRQLSLGDITQESDRGKEAVKAYQRKVICYTGSSVDGIISNGQNTFKVLKCHVADTMDIPLPNRPQICDSARL